MSITATAYLLSLDNTLAALLLWFAQGPHLLVILTSTAATRPQVEALPDQYAQVFMQAPGLLGWQSTDQNGFAAYSPTAAAMVSHVMSAGV